jgi:hypothetical protein
MSCLKPQHRLLISVHLFGSSGSDEGRHAILNVPEGGFDPDSFINPIAVLMPRDVITSPRILIATITPFCAACSQGIGEPASLVIGLPVDKRILKPAGQKLMKADPQTFLARSLLAELSEKAFRSAPVVAVVEISRG